MIKLGLTGNIASGKSLVEGFLKEFGVPVIDSDEIVHNLYAQNTIIERIKNIFEGEDVLENGVLSRAKIGKIVFNDREKLKKLEGILHPEVKKEIKRFFESNMDKDFAAASIPLLFEIGMEEFFDCIIVVAADEKIRIERLKNRNNLSEDDARLRINSQMSQEEKIKRSNFVIDNNRDMKYTKNQLEEILAQLKTKKF